MSRLPALLRRLPQGDQRPDADLLAAFRADHDEAAFAEVVRRHGPLVWAVCRRHLPDLADAEDAFQAAFLVLVRRAGRLGASPGVGPWLYRVAAWTARNVRRKNARMLARRKPMPADLGTLTGAARWDFDLDDALLALPEKYRTPLVLCHLQGWTRRAAAEHLGCPEGTLSSLISRGLAKLRTRLAGRDPAAVLVVAAAGAVPAELAAATVRTAAAFRLAAASPALVHLTEGVLRMFWVKKAAASGVAAMMLLTTGVGVGLGVKQVPAAVAADDKPKPAGAANVSPQRSTEVTVIDIELESLRKQADLYAAELKRLLATHDALTAQAQLAQKQLNDSHVRAAELMTRRKDLLDTAKAGPPAAKPPEKADKPGPTKKDTDRQRERETAVQVEQIEIRKLEAEAALLEDQDKLLQTEHDRVRVRKAETEIRRRELLARIDRLKGEAGKADTLRDFELVIGSPKAQHPYSFIERGADGDAILLASAPGEQGLRRHLARVAADPKGPKTVHISVAYNAPAARLQAALDAIKAAGFAGTTKRTLNATVGTADEQGDTLAREAVEQFFKALAAKDTAALLRVADVPWWWDESRITRDRADLEGQVRKALAREGFAGEDYRFAVIAPLTEFEQTINKKLPADRRKKLEQLLGPEHRLVQVEIEKDGRKGEGILAVRIQDGKARVVGVVKY